MYFQNNLRYFAMIQSHHLVGAVGGLKSTRFFYKEIITWGMQICYTGKGSLNELCPRF